MKKIIKELFKNGETRKDVLLHEAYLINMTNKEKQQALIKKMREIARENTAFANRTILRFKW